MGEGISLNIAKIFYSLQGEGVHQGVPTTFIRLQGCNFLPGLGCKWCDTVYAQESNKGKSLSIEDILAEVVAAESRTYQHWVCITGGEPLFQLKGLHELVKALKKYGLLTEIETNGSISKPFWWTLVDSWVADIKCPSSGVCGVSKEEEWFDTRKQDQVKFVVGSAKDIDFARQMIMRNAARNPTVLISPVILPDGTAPCMKEAINLSLRLKVRFSLQIHKYAEVE